ncbi:hypothetical protein DYB32_004648 [Aphanomyces invadans]|uniref:Uncharacterized protein n=1 Tax=Aphanomyces invadans TaxID=157072 RepID=A0A418AWX3_9STRA|nr:hypothetical protein DYB32_004648 [Aphanomyces invadans]
MSWCNRADEKLLAVTSFTEVYENQLQILKVVDATPESVNPIACGGDGTDMDVDDASSKNCVSLQSLAAVDHPYPPTKVLWSPDGTTSKLVTTADYLRLWHMQGDSIQVKATFSKYRAHENTSPITSADWNVADPNILATTSVDTSICIWDINVSAHESIVLVHDVAHGTTVEQ